METITEPWDSIFGRLLNFVTEGSKVQNLCCLYMSGNLALISHAAFPKSSAKDDSTNCSLLFHTLVNVFNYQTTCLLDFITQTLRTREIPESSAAKVGDSIFSKNADCQFIHGSAGNHMRSFPNKEEARIESFVVQLPDLPHVGTQSHEYLKT